MDGAQNLVEDTHGCSDGGKMVKKKGCFRKLSCLEKRMNELALQETHSWNNTS